MTAAATRKLIATYYERFNDQDVEGFLALLTPGVVHEISQGGSEKGKAKFRAFLGHMNACYRERVSDLAVMTSADGSRAAAEFRLDGRYIKTDGDFVAAKGQRYRLRVGAFFVIKGGRIARISNHYNLKDWLRQVGG
ncbi:MAG: nuclear transport factor 2 family protein [Alphaproteobacteria bacterium]|nr:nuclear transport factor 2 family protein [Alphaproteobacteria bacterium]